MTNCSYIRGDIVLVELVFTQGGGSKKRPAYIISGNKYHQSRDEVIVAAITSNTTSKRVGDTKVKNWQAAGLLFPSLVAGILQTIKRGSIIKKLGRLSASDARSVEKSIRTALALNGK